MTYGTPIIEAPDVPLPMPDAYTAEQSRGVREAVQSIKDKAVDAINNDQSEGAMERYVAERRDEEARKAGDPAIDLPGAEASPVRALRAGAGNRTERQW